MIQPKPEIVNARLTSHGGYHAHEWDQRELLDFSANINPFGASPRVREALLRAPFERHPDPDSTELRACLSQQLALAAEQIIVGNGSLELIRNLAMAYVRAGDICSVVGPTFGEYRVACELQGGHVVALYTEAATMFVPDVQRIAETIQHVRPRLVFICNPNNPTGVYLSRESIELILQACTRSLLVLDEAFVQFVEQRWTRARCWMRVVSLSYAR